MQLHRSSFRGITLSATNGHTLLINAPWTEHDCREVRFKEYLPKVGNPKVASPKMRRIGGDLERVPNLRAANVDIPPGDRRAALERNAFPRQLGEARRTTPSSRRRAAHRRLEDSASAAAGGHPAIGLASRPRPEGGSAAGERLTHPEPAVSRRKRGPPPPRNPARWRRRAIGQARERRTPRDRQPTGCDHAAASVTYPRGRRIGYRRAGSDRPTRLSAQMCVVRRFLREETAAVGSS